MLFKNTWNKNVNAKIAEKFHLSVFHSKMSANYAQSGSLFSSEIAAIAIESMSHSTKRETFSTLSQY
jgi:hypothetical protein